MKNVLKKFMKDDSGLELVEYALMLALLIVGITAAAFALKGDITTIWGNAHTALTTASS